VRGAIRRTTPWTAVIPQPIPVPASQDQICELADRWILHPVLAVKLAAMAQLVPFGLSIISGFRTVERQLELRDEGRPAADPQVSTHCSCPATGADLRIDGLSPGNYEKTLFGSAAVRAGLRWGGGSPLVDNIPSDWNHVDLGPRSS